MNHSLPFSLLFLGTSHKTAPLEIRENFSVSKEKLQSLQLKIQSTPSILESLILTTCNRTELYCVVTPNFNPSTLLNIFCDHLRINTALFQKHSFFLHNKDVIQHLFHVASGMNSQILGENEILSQVKTAYAQAKSMNTIGPIFHRLFQKSFQTAKAIRTHTAIGQGATSIGSVAAELGLRIFGDLSNVRTLLIGTGEAGQLTASALKLRGNHHLTLVSRTFENAVALASKLSAVPLPIEKLDSHIANFDIIITCTTYDKPLITPDSFPQNLSNLLFLMDLSFPRNICPTTASVQNIYLYNLDDLATIANENLKSRVTELSKCHSILSYKTDLLWDYLTLKAPHPLPPHLGQETLSPSSST